MNPMPVNVGRPFSVALPIGRYAYTRGFTLMDLATLSGVHPRTLSDYVNGRKPINPKHLDRLADALGVKPQDLNESA
jgi:transcriptional regulator with XRE-family HTH domain